MLVKLSLQPCKSLFFQSPLHSLHSNHPASLLLLKHCQPHFCLRALALAVPFAWNILPQIHLAHSLISLKPFHKSPFSMWLTCYVITLIISDASLAQPAPLPTTQSPAVIWLLFSFFHNSFHLLTYDIILTYFYILLFTAISPHRM